MYSPRKSSHIINTALRCAKYTYITIKKVFIRLVNTIKLTTSQLAMVSIKSISKCARSATNPFRNLHLAATIITILFI